MKHEIFGKIEYDNLWKRDYSIKVYTQSEEGLLYVEAENDEEFQENQIQAFKKFEERKEEFEKQVKKAIFNYYNEVVGEYRDRYGDSADELAPLVKVPDEMEKLLEFQSLNIPYSFEDDERVIGVLFKAKWEIEHGVAVKFVNEEVIEVGYQDIIL